MPCIIHLCNLGFLGYLNCENSDKQLEKTMAPSRAIKCNDADVNSSSGSWGIILVEISSVFFLYFSYAYRLFSMMR